MSPRLRIVLATTISRAASTSGSPPPRRADEVRATGIRSPRWAMWRHAPSRIRLATMTLVLGYHHPLAIVKRYGTLDHVSGGRVILGVGVGTLREEFDLLGAPFDDRGDRADDALRALRAGLSSNEPVYAGKYYSFGGLTVDPCALQDRMPIWIGGRTRRSLRRALTLADGWCPFGIPLDTAAEWLGAREIPPGFEVVLPADQPLDPVGEPAATVDTLAAMAGRRDDDRVCAVRPPLAGALPRADPRARGAASPRRLAWVYAVTHSAGPRGHRGSTQGRAHRCGGARSLRAHRPLR